MEEVKDNAYKRYNAVVNVLKNVRIKNGKSVRAPQLTAGTHGLFHFRCYKLALLFCDSVKSSWQWCVSLES